MAPCLALLDFGIGWVTRQNHRRFASLAAREEAPMGVLALIADEPVGWVACGPRSRYLPLGGVGDTLLADRDRSEDDVVWLVPCFYLHPQHRSSGVSHALLEASIATATAHHAAAVEAWPAVVPGLRWDAFRGRTELFTQAGFTQVAGLESQRLGVQRVLLRLDLV
jgi:GNAT superfamily N-acetyltransferase